MQIFPKYLGDGVSVTTLSKEFNRRTSLGRLAWSFKFMSETEHHRSEAGLENIFEDHFNDFKQMAGLFPAMDVSLLSQFLKFTYNLKHDPDHENGSAEDGTLVWLAEQYSRSTKENKGKINAPYQTLIYSIPNGQGGQDILGTWSFVKTDRGEEKRLKDGPPDAIIGYFQINRDYRGQGYENIILNHMVHYILDAVDSYYQAPDYAGGTFRLGLFTRPSMMNLAERFGVKPENKISGGDFEGELLGALAITPELSAKLRAQFTKAPKPNVHQLARAAEAGRAPAL